MPKEDRSDWVAVAPEFSSVGDKIRPVTTAYQFFQRDISEQVKSELGPGFKVFEFGRAVKEKWNQLENDKRSHYERLSAEDRARFARESHIADVAALERRERLQKERDTLLLDDEGGTQRTTRRAQAKKIRKKDRKEKKEKRKLAEKMIRKADDEDFQEEDEESSDAYSAESDEESTDSDSDDSDRPIKKSKKMKPKRQLSEKQIEYRKKMQEEKRMKETIIAERQEDVRKEKANQAKRRLEFLLKQSNIFSHFGQVKQDQAKYGIKSGAPRNNDGNATSRRDTLEDDDNQEELDEADEHQATFLTAQPTTLGFGKMRQYQLEGLNWMIGLQENGVNGILADEVCALFFFPSFI